jgi:hypothetical protein
MSSNFIMNPTIKATSPNGRGRWHHRERTADEVLTHRIMGGWFGLRKAERLAGLPRTSLDEYREAFAGACRRLKRPSLKRPKKLTPTQILDRALHNVAVDKLGL